MRKKDEELCETSGRGRRSLALWCALALGSAASFGCLNPRPEEFPSSNLEPAPATDADEASRQSGPTALDAPAAGGDEAAAPENLVPGPTSAEAPPSTFDAPVGDAGVGADAGSDSDAGAD